MASGISLAQDSVRVALDCYNPPYMYEKEGQAAGLYPVLLSEVFTRMEVDVALIPLPWKRALSLAMAGEGGVAGIYKNDQRSMVLDYSDAIYEERIMLFVTAKNVFDFKAIDDLNGKTVGALLGWSYGEAFDSARVLSNFSVEEVKSDSLNFDKLVKGRVDCVVATKESGLKIIQSGNGRYEQVRMLEVPVAVNRTYLVFSKTNDRRVLLQSFNTVLQSIKDDGTYDRLIKKELGLQ